MAEEKTVRVSVTNSDNLFEYSVEFLEKYLDWLKTSFSNTDKDGKFYWTNEAAGEEYAKVEVYLYNKRIRDEGLALRRKFAFRFNKYANKIKKGEEEE